MSIRAEVEKLTANFVSAVTEKDFAALGPFYEDNARLLAPGARMVTGRAAIVAAQRHMIEGGVQALALECVDVIEVGDLAIEIERINVTVQVPSATPVTDTGKSVVVWRRQPDGTLRIVVDIFNSDTPIHLGSSADR